MARRHRVGLAGALLAAAGAVGAFGAAGAAAQSIPAQGDWRAFETTHFRVTYSPELEGLARRAAGVAERTYAVLREELADPPAGRIDLLVANNVDYTNGFANHFPSPRITVYARPPTGAPQLAFARDWIELVVAHELVHIFHLEESGPVGNVVRRVLGRVPTIWPVFPVGASPTWNVEGLATYYESRLTGAGRIPASFHDMLIRTAALEDGIPDLHDVSAPQPAWPGGQRSYVYGGRLMAYIADRHGPEAHRALIEATGRSIRPTFLFFDHVAEVALGEPFDDLYDAWRLQATAAAHALAERITARGVTVTRALGETGPYVHAPRVSPDGRQLSFAAHDFRSAPATRVLDIETGSTRTIQERNELSSTLGPASWLPNGSAMLVAQLETPAPGRVHSDLWMLALDGGEQRLTRGLRLAQPDVAPDGRRVAAIQNHHGAIRLVVHDLESGETRAVVDALPGDAFESPRWSPDGTRIAAGRYVDGRVDLVLVDPATGTVRAVTDDDALDLAPAWSPDGEWLLWWSDRSGVPNILAVRSADGAVQGPIRQVTNVLTGAFDPEVGADGATLYMTVYHHDGWAIEAMPFDPSTWTPAGEPELSYVEGLLPPPARANEVEGGPSSTYSPWPTVRPYYWLPDWRSLSSAGGTLHFLGVNTDGYDLVGRHAWRAAAGVDLGTGRTRWDAAWTYRRLMPLELTAATQREWDLLGTVAVPGGEEAIYRRTDEVSLDAILYRPRWRSTTWLRVGAEMEWRANEAHDMTVAELRDAGWELRQLDALVGVSAGPGISTERWHPYSISAEDGYYGALGAGRWWNVSTGERAYDEVSGRVRGYFDFRGWGFANHVLAARVSALARAGDAAFARSIGGITSGSAPYIRYAFPGGSAFPIRGYDTGVRYGTRAWTASAEWRFPLHMRSPYGGIMGFSLTSIAGSIFADAGDAWCTGTQLAAGLPGCVDAGLAPLVSGGAELVVNFGAFHNTGVILRLGGAQPRHGDGPVFYAAFGPSF